MIPVGTSRSSHKLPATVLSPRCVRCCWGAEGAGGSGKMRRSAGWRRSWRSQRRWGRRSRRRRVARRSAGAGLALPARVVPRGFMLCGVCAAWETAPPGEIGRAAHGNTRPPARVVCCARLCWPRERRERCGRALRGRYRFAALRVGRRDAREGPLPHGRPGRGHRARHRQAERGAGRRRRAGAGALSGGPAARRAGWGWPARPALPCCARAPRASPGGRHARRGEAWLSKDDGPGGSRKRLPPRLPADGAGHHRRRARRARHRVPAGHEEHRPRRVQAGHAREGFARLVPLPLHAGHLHARLHQTLRRRRLRWRGLARPLPHHPR